MTVARLGTSLVMELMRLLDAMRNRLTSPDTQATSQGDYTHFTSLQCTLLHLTPL